MDEIDLTKPHGWMRFAAVLPAHPESPYDVVIAVFANEIEAAQFIGVSSFRRLEIRPLIYHTSGGEDALPDAVRLWAESS